MSFTNSERDFDDLVEKNEDAPRLLIEGDSWVSHPFLINLNKQFDNITDGEFNILNVSYPGDTADRILRKNGRQFKQLKKYLHNESFGYKFDLIFISAAGNDIVGPEVKDYVFSKQQQPAMFGRERLKASFYAMLVAIRKDYERFLKMRNKTLINNTTPVVTHVYSYLKPRQIGTPIFGRPFSKGWVARYLDQLGINDEDEQIDIAMGMLDGFHDELQNIEEENFLVVDTRKILMKGNKPDVSLFYDEIHPSGRGFKKVAKRIIKDAKADNYWPNT